MGHMICRIDERYDCDRDAVSRGVSDRARREGDWGCGIDLEWREGDVFDDHAAAERFLVGHDGDYGRDFVVLYRFGRKTEAADDALARCRRLHTERDRFVSQSHVANRKSTTVGCDCCGLVVPTALLGPSKSHGWGKGRLHSRDGYVDCCPYCEKTFLSRSSAERLASYDRRVADADAAAARHFAWLGRYEFHA